MKNQTDIKENVGDLINVRDLTHTIAMTLLDYKNSSLGTYDERIKIARNIAIDIKSATPTANKNAAELVEPIGKVEVKSRYNFTSCEQKDEQIRILREGLVDLKTKLRVCGLDIATPNIIFGINDVLAQADKIAREGI